MPNSLSPKIGKIEIFSTIAGDIDIEKLQQPLEQSRNILINGYLAKNFAKIETILACDFRFVNGKEIRTRDNWQKILENLWQSRDWQANPLLPERTRYHFFSPTESMITLYYKDEQVANVMQELWMKDDTLWKLSAVSIVNR